MFRILQLTMHILMSGTERSNKQMEWRASYSPSSEPTINEILITLRTLFYFRKRSVSQLGFVRQYLIETIGFLERVAPKEIKNIINLMYNTKL